MQFSNSPSCVGGEFIYFQRMVIRAASSSSSRFLYVSPRHSLKTLQMLKNLSPRRSAELVPSPTCMPNVHSMKLPSDCFYIHACGVAAKLGLPFLRGSAYFRIAVLPVEDHLQTSVVFNDRFFGDDVRTAFPGIQTASRVLPWKFHVRQVA